MNASFYVFTPAICRYYKINLSKQLQKVQFCMSETNYSTGQTKEDHWYTKQQAL